MITSLSAYKAIIGTPASGNADQRGDNAISSLDSAIPLSRGAQKVDGGSPPEADPVEISVSREVFTAVDSFFNLGKSGRFDDFHNLSREEKEQFVKIVAELAKTGYMGYEELTVNKKVERHDVLNQIGDQRLRSAELYDESKNKIR